MRWVTMESGANEPGPDARWSPRSPRDDRRLAMQLALTPEEAAFREELRTFYTTEIPEDLRELVRQGSSLSRDQLVTTQKILNDHGLAVPNWPVEWGGKDWT